MESAKISRWPSRYGWILALAAFAALFSVVIPVIPSAGAQEPLFAELERRLISDGLDAALVAKLYGDRRVRLLPEVVAANLTRREARLDYAQFLQPYAVSRAKRYRRRHHRALTTAASRFGVGPEIVVAILMVETALGSYTGNYPTFNVLSTMAAAGDQAVRRKILAHLGRGKGDTMTTPAIEKKLLRRVRRSYRELKALIVYADTIGADPLELRGSSEGAIGIPQFLPSNIERYGRDGDGDGTVDLFDHADAIFSVAAFLHGHRWQATAAPERQRRVLLHYNRSTYYVDTVLRLAERIAAADQASKAD